MNYQIINYLDELDKKIEKSKTVSADTPRIGIFWLHLKEGKPAAFNAYDEAVEFGQRYGDFIVCAKEHYTFWEFLKKNNYVPKNSNYEDLPRGRLAYDNSTNEYVVFTGNWIDNHADVKNVIISEFKLKSNTRWETDFHYNKIKRWGF